MCALKKKIYTGEDSDEMLHKHDFEWLLEAAVKVSVGVYVRSM